MAKDPGATLRSASKISLSATPRNFNDRIDRNDKLDTFRFILQQRSSFNLALTGLQANANVTVLNSRNQTIARSNLPKRQNEAIKIVLDAGTYYVQVSAASQRDQTRYRLTLSAGNSAPVVEKFNLFTRPGTNTTINRDTFATADAEQSAENLIYTLTNLPQNGQLRLNGAVLAVGGQFTQADIDSGRLSYTSVGTVTRLTDDAIIDAAGGISGSNVIWGRVEGQSFKGFFYDGQTGQTKQISGLDNLLPTSISGSKVAGYGLKGTFVEVFLYDGATGVTTLLTNNTASGTAVFISGFVVISGNNVIWSQTDGKAFFYNGQTGGTTQLTYPGIVAAAAGGVSGSKVAWIGSNGTTNEVFLFDAATGTSTQVTNNAVNEVGSAISGDNIVWNTLEGQSYRTFFYNIPTRRQVELTAPGISSSLAVAMDGTNVAWNGFDGNDTEVFLYNDTTGTSTQLTTNNINDGATGISGSNVVWGGLEGTDTDIFFYDGTTRTTTLLTNDTTNDSFPYVSSSNVVWTNFDGTDTDVVLRRFATADRFNFTVADGVGAITNGTLNITIS